MKNYYSTLGIDKNSTPEQIKQAYRRLASQHHPDKGGDTAQFQEIQEAYAVLSDADKRQQYDNPQPQFNTGFGGTNFDFDTIFNIFGADLRNQARQSPRLSLWITLADVITGGPRTISLQTGNNTSADVVINIPAGIHDNDNIRYPGLAPGGGDLIINYRVRPDPNWQCNGTNIITEVTIDIWDLIIGKDLSIVDVLGKELSVRVPAETQPGSVLRARGRGLPARGLAGDRPNAPTGDLMIRLNARITSPVDPDIVEAIRKFKEK